MSEIEYAAQQAANYAAEAEAERQTDQVFVTINAMTASARRQAEADAIDSCMNDALSAAERRERKQQALARKHRRRKWQGVKRCGKILLGVAAAYGFECLTGLPHELSLACMVTMLILALYILTAQIIPEVLWFLRRKAVRAR